MDSRRPVRRGARAALSLARAAVAARAAVGVAGHLDVELALEGVGAVVDPIGDIAPYRQAAADVKVRLSCVIDTHLHADHISAGRALAEATGADYVLFAEAPAFFPFRAVRDGEAIELGNVMYR